MAFVNLFRLLLTGVLVVGFSNMLWACDSCSITRIGRAQGQKALSGRDGGWFTQYLYEHQNWHEKEAGEAHRLHHQGHHIHAKVYEEFHHVTIGRRFNDRLTLSVEVPYVIRHSLEVHDHAILGTRQKSQGLGDLQFLGDWRLFKDESSSLSAIAGARFPTGSVKETNSIGDRFEQELQPGSGSYDHIAGGAYRKTAGRSNWVANMAYVFKNEGAQDYRYGDLFSTSVVADYLINPQSQNIKTRLGLDVNFQYEQKHKDAGDTVKDSGGSHLFLGPTLSVEPKENFGIHAAFMLPVMQDPGGVHQTYDHIWTLGAKLDW